jgi:hypothetical protein
MGKKKVGDLMNASFLDLINMKWGKKCKKLRKKVKNKR